MNQPPVRSPVIEPEIIALYDEYTHAPLPRRVFFKRLTALAGSTAAATALLPLLENNYAQAALIGADDPRVSSARVGVASAHGTIAGYLAAPKDVQDKVPAVIVIHENRGLNPHIEDVARRLAIAGFLAFAPDYLSGQGGTPADEDAARDLIAKLPDDEVVATSAACLKYLKSHPRSSGAVGVVGFCWGGGYANRLAVDAPELAACVAFYGMQPKASDVARIQAALQLHYAGLDERIDAGIDAFETALKAHDKRYELYLYEGVNHAFHNDTNAARYNEAAARLAWARTVEFFKRYLR